MKYIPYYVGISVVFGSHVYLIYNNKTMSLDEMKTHSYLNIGAAGLIAYDFLTNMKK